MAFGIIDPLECLHMDFHGTVRLNSLLTHPKTRAQST